MVGSDLRTLQAVLPDILPTSNGNKQTTVDVFDRTIHETEASPVVIFRGKWAVGLLLLIPPLTPLGLVFLLSKSTRAATTRPGLTGDPVARRDGSLVWRDHPAPRAPIGAARPGHR
jgi:hypothetical protein